LEKTHHKNRKLQAKTNKKILFTEFGNSDQAAKEPWTESENTINIGAKPMRMNLISDINSKKWFAGGLPGNGMPMIITNVKKNSVDYTPQEKLP
jgi:hypothetical protein